LIFSVSVVEGLFGMLCAHKRLLSLRSFVDEAAKNFGIKL